MSLRRYLFGSLQYNASTRGPGKSRHTPGAPSLWHNAPLNNLNSNDRIPTSGSLPAYSPPYPPNSAPRARL